MRPADTPAPAVQARLACRVRPSPHIWARSAGRAHIGSKVSKLSGHGLSNSGCSVPRHRMQPNAGVHDFRARTWGDRNLATAGVVAGTHARGGPHGFDELPFRNGTSVSGRSRGWPAARANARQQARWSSLVQTAPASGGLRSARTGKAPPSGPRGMPLGPRVRTDHMSGSSPASRRLAARPQVSRCGQPAAVRRARPLR